MPTVCELSLLLCPVARLSDTSGPLVDSHSSTCCESFDARTCIDSGRHYCRFIRPYKGNMLAEREGCAPQCREACTCSTHILSLLSVFQWHGHIASRSSHRSHLAHGGYDRKIEWFTALRLLADAWHLSSASHSKKK